MNMDVAIVQADLHWEAPEANRNQLAQLMDDSEGADLIVLPEMFNTAFSNRSSELSESMDGDTVSWMKAEAKKRNCVITGSLMIAEEGQYYNRMLWVSPKGISAQYDKRHLFRMAGEHNHFSPGQERVVVEHKGWRIMLQICYDLRFPVFARNQYAGGAYDYDLIIYVANWPSPRHNAWEGLLRARAMENLSYCIGVNRVGKDGNGHSYNGGSVVLDYLGNELSPAIDGQGISRAQIDLLALRKFREKFPTGMDADPFTLLT